LADGIPGVEKGTNDVDEVFLEEIDKRHPEFCDGAGRPLRHFAAQDLLKLSPEDRADAPMFYIGYQASHLRARTINVA
jgi:hypothetical protein